MFRTTSNSCAMGFFPLILMLCCGCSPVQLEPGIQGVTFYSGNAEVIPEAIVSAASDGKESLAPNIPKPVKWWGSVSSIMIYQENDSTITASISVGERTARRELEVLDADDSKQSDEYNSMNVIGSLRSLVTKTEGYSETDVLLPANRPLPFRVRLNGFKLFGYVIYHETPATD
jgi:hypothetical protein